MEYSHKMQQFCEKKLYPNQPEYFNSISALFICYMSYKDLKKSHKLSNITILIHSCIFTNGIAAFLYHWFDWYIFKLLDAYSMIIPLWIGIGDLLIRLEYSNIYIIITTIINQIILVLTVFPWFDKYFAWCFAGEMLLLIPLYKQSLLITTNNKKKGLKGLIICTGSGIIWVITERNCNKYMLLGHSIWHIGMSIGLSSLIGYLDNNNKKLI